MAYISKVTTTDNNEYDIKSKVTAAIPYGECDSTSTATAFTATVDGITSLYDGVTVMLRNGVVTSASGFTININGLGAKPVYNNMATGNPVTPTNPTRGTTIFNINYTMLLVYGSNIVSGGGWICYSGGSGLPAVTTADDGKILRVVDGVWAAATLNSASGVSF